MNNNLTQTTQDTENVAYDCYLEINKHIAEIEKICRVHSIPMLVTYANPITEQYISDVITPKSLGIELSVDKISKLNMALNNNFSIKIQNNDPKSYAGELFESIIDEL